MRIANDFERTIGLEPAPNHDPDALDVARGQDGSNRGVLNRVAGLAREGSVRARICPGELQRIRTAPLPGDFSRERDRALNGIDARRYRRERDLRVQEVHAHRAEPRGLACHGARCGVDHEIRELRPLGSVPALNDEVSGKHPSGKRRWVVLDRDGDRNAKLRAFRAEYIRRSPYCRGSSERRRRAGRGRDRQCDSRRDGTRGQEQRDAAVRRGHRASSGSYKAALTDRYRSRSALSLTHSGDGCGSHCHCGHQAGSGHRGDHRRAASPCDRPTGEHIPGGVARGRGELVGLLWNQPRAHRRHGEERH